MRGPVQLILSVANPTIVSGNNTGVVKNYSLVRFKHEEYFSVSV
jgi:hypothetical protein